MKPDWNKMLRVYRQVTKDLTGLVLRSEEYMKMLELRKIIQSEKTIQTEEGYAFLKEDEGRVSIKEIMAPTKEETVRLIKKAEDKALRTVVDRTVLSERILNAYESQEYMTLTHSYGVLMAKPLIRSTTFKEIYGNNFYLTSADIF